MTYTRRLEIMEARFQALRDLGAKKSSDYAPGADTLQNFKNGAASCRNSPFQYLMNLAQKQWDAIQEACSKGGYPTTGYESLIDKVQDVIMYMVLVECLLEDLKPSDPDLVADAQKAIAESGDAIDFLPYLKAAQTAKTGEEIQDLAAHAKAGWKPVGTGELVSVETMRDAKVGDKFVRATDGSPVEFLGVWCHDPTGYVFRDLTDGERFVRVGLEVATLRKVIA